LVKVWDLHNGTIVHTLKGHAGSIGCLALAWNRQRALSGASDGHLIMWDLAAGKELWVTDAHESELTACAVDWEANRACSGDASGEIKVWQLQPPLCVARMSSHQDEISGLSLAMRSGAHCVSADAALVLSTSWDGTLRCWRLVDGLCLASWQEVSQGRVQGLTCLAVDWQAGSFLCGHGKTMTLWDARHGGITRRFSGHNDAVSCIALEPGEPFEMDMVASLNASMASPEV